MDSRLPLISDVCTNGAKGTGARGAGRGGPRTSRFWRGICWNIERKSQLSLGIIYNEGIGFEVVTEISVVY